MCSIYIYVCVHNYEEALYPNIFKIDHAQIHIWGADNGWFFRVMHLHNKNKPRHMICNVYYNINYYFTRSISITEIANCSNIYVYIVYDYELQSDHISSDIEKASTLQNTPPHVQNIASIHTQST